MRRIMYGAALILLAAILCSTAAGEGWFPTWENTPTPAPTAPSDGTFTFRNSIHWAMSPEQVREATETGIQMEERSQESWSVLYSVGRVEVSRFFADLVYIFQDRQLNMILYAFDRGEPQSSYTYLTGALGSVYGEPEKAETSEVVNLMERVYPGMYTADGLSQVNAWTAADGSVPAERCIFFHPLRVSFRRASGGRQLSDQWTVIWKCSLKIHL